MILANIGLAMIAVGAEHPAAGEWQAKCNHDQ
jgi:hypothetical protein